MGSLETLTSSSSSFLPFSRTRTSSLDEVKGLAEDILRFLPFINLSFYLTLRKSCARVVRNGGSGGCVCVRVYCHQFTIWDFQVFESPRTSRRSRGTPQRGRSARATSRSRCPCEELYVLFGRVFKCCGLDGRQTFPNQSVGYLDTKYGVVGVWHSSPFAAVREEGRSRA